MTEKVLNLGENAAEQPVFVTKATDPVTLPQPYAQTTDFTAQYPTPLDTTEILALCEEISVWKAIPEVRTGLQQYTWREMDYLYMVSGSSNIDAYIAFADGECPEEYDHSGHNFTIDLESIGAKKTLSYSDIMHSQAVAGAGGIGSLLGGYASGEGMPGASDIGTFQREVVRNVKEKEARLMMTLIMNGWDNLLVNGDHTTNSLEFDGIEHWSGWDGNCTFGSNDNSASGTFSATAFDRFLSEGCAKPTHIFGHSTAIQEMLSGYFQLGFQGSQLVNFTSGDRLVPGFNFAGFVNTGIGRLQVVADNNFTRTASATGIFQSNLYTLRMTHNGDPLVYKITQIPLSYKDLAPGCTAISFEMWAKTALVIKMCCAQRTYTSQFTGRISSSCTAVG
jgi:hypothetical protein